MAEFDFTVFPTLTTPRLILREMETSDAAELFRFLSDPEVYRYDTNKPLEEIAEAVALIEKAHQDFATQQGINWGIAFKADDRLTGRVGVYFWGPFQVFLGYVVACPYWNRGIATEAVGAVMRFGFQTLHLHRVNADIWMGNTASTRVVEKLGFRPEGMRRDFFRKGDGPYDGLVYFGLLENEYRLTALSA